MSDNSRPYTGHDASKKRDAAALRTCEEVMHPPSIYSSITHKSGRKTTLPFSMVQFFARCADLCALEIALRVLRSPQLLLDPLNLCLVQAVRVRAAVHLPFLLVLADFVRGGANVGRGLLGVQQRHG